MGIWRHFYLYQQDQKQEQPPNLGWRKCTPELICGSAGLFSVLICKDVWRCQCFQGLFRSQKTVASSSCSLTPMDNHPCRLSWQKLCFLESKVAELSTVRTVTLSVPLPKKRTFIRNGSNGVRFSSYLQLPFSSKKNNSILNVYLHSTRDGLSKKQSQIITFLFWT